MYVSDSDSTYLFQQGKSIVKAERAKKVESIEVSHENLSKPLPLGTHPFLL